MSSINRWRLWSCIVNTWLCNKSNKCYGKVLPIQYNTKSIYCHWLHFDNNRHI